MSFDPKNLGIESSISGQPIYQEEGKPKTSVDKKTEEAATKKIPNENKVKPKESLNKRKIVFQFFRNVITSITSKLFFCFGREKKKTDQSDSVHSELISATKDKSDTKGPVIGTNQSGYETNFEEDENEFLDFEEQSVYNSQENDSEVRFKDDDEEFFDALSEEELQAIEPGNVAKGIRAAKQELEKLEQGVAEEKQVKMLKSAMESVGNVKYNRLVKQENPSKEFVVKTLANVRLAKKLLSRLKEEKKQPMEGINLPFCQAAVENAEKLIKSAVVPKLGALEEEVSEKELQQMLNGYYAKGSEKGSWLLRPLDHVVGISDNVSEQVHHIRKMWKGLISSDGKPGEAPVDKLMKNLMTKAANFPFGRIKDMKEEEFKGALPKECQKNTDFTSQFNFEGYKSNSREWKNRQLSLLKTFSTITEHRKEMILQLSKSSPKNKSAFEKNLDYQLENPTHLADKVMNKLSLEQIEKAVYSEQQTCYFSEEEKEAFPKLRKKFEEMNKLVSEAQRNFAESKTKFSEMNSCFADYEQTQIGGIVQSLLTEQNKSIFNTLRDNLNKGKEFVRDLATKAGISQKQFDVRNLATKYVEDQIMNTLIPSIQSMMLPLHFEPNSEEAKALGEQVENFVKNKPKNYKPLHRDMIKETIGTITEKGIPMGSLIEKASSMIPWTNKKKDDYSEFFDFQLQQALESTKSLQDGDYLNQTVFDQLFPKEISGLSQDRIQTRMPLKGIMEGGKQGLGERLFYRANQGLVPRFTKPAIIQLFSLHALTELNQQFGNIAEDIKSN